MKQKGIYWRDIVLLTQSTGRLERSGWENGQDHCRMNCMAPGGHHCLPPPITTQCCHHQTLHVVAPRILTLTTTLAELPIITELAPRIVFHWLCNFCHSPRNTGMLKPRWSHTPAPGAREQCLAISDSITGDTLLPPSFTLWRISHKRKHVWTLGSQTTADV